jgi:chemotaxis protein MotA
MISRYGAAAGLLLGLVCIFGAFLIEGGSVKALFLIPPLLVVFGGTFSAVIIGYGLNKFFSAMQLIKLAFFPPEYNLERLINIFINFSIISRKEGLLAIEKYISSVDYPFTRKILKYAVDGTDPVSLENLAMLEIRSMDERHAANIQIFSKMGGYAPTMGIIGTVMGLIMTLANAGENPDLLIRNIASAFIATLWGIVSANILWLPISDKLKRCHSEEKYLMELSLEGVLALQGGEIPSMVKARLLSMLPLRDQEKPAFA